MTDWGTLNGVPVRECDDACDHERDELLRWAAEDVLGWVPYDWTTHGRAYVYEYDETEKSWHDPRWEAGPPHTQNDLMGWPGFGLAVETARARGLVFDLSLCPDGYLVRFSPDWKDGDVAHDPALAAWAALREALSPLETREIHEVMPEGFFRENATRVPTIEQYDDRDDEYASR